MIILYIEGDKDDIELFQEALFRVDPTISLLSARGFSDALAKLKDAVKPDAIFVDYHLPGINGHECIKDFKHDDGVLLI